MVSCLNSNACSDDPYSLRAYVKDASPALKLSYGWTVRGGRIVSGQGTPQVTVIGDRTLRVVNRGGRWTEEMLLGSLTATVILTGAPSQCVNTAASLSMMVGDHWPRFQLVQEFGRVSFSQLKTNLDSFAQVLQSQPGAMGYIVSEGNWPFEKRAKEYLLVKQKLTADRVKYVARKKTKELNVKLYLVPSGATPPS